MTDKDTLKVQALKERISELVGDYEDKVADIRAEVTMVVSEYEEKMAALNAEVDSLKAQLQPHLDAQPQDGEDVPDVVS